MSLDHNYLEDWLNRVRLGINGILRQIDVETALECCRSLTQDESIWIAKTEMDRINALGYDYLRFDIHAGSNEIIAEERAKLVKLIQRYENELNPNLLEYARLWSEKTKGMVKKINVINAEICQIAGIELNRPAIREQAILAGIEPNGAKSTN